MARPSGALASTAISQDARETLLARFFSAIGGRSAEESYQLFNPRDNIGWHDPAQTAAEMEKLLNEQAA